MKTTRTKCLDRNKVASSRRTFFYVMGMTHRRGGHDQDGRKVSFKASVSCCDERNEETALATVDNQTRNDASKFTIASTILANTRRMIY